jgi:hypothetical protein
MEIHHHNAVFPLPRRLHRTNPHTRRIITMVAQNEEWLTLHPLINIFVFDSWKDMPVGFIPEPFYFFFRLAEIRDIMRDVAGVDAVMAALRTFHDVDDHGPSAGLQGVGTRQYLRLFRLRERIEHRLHSKPQEACPGNLQEAPSALHHALSFGSIWQSQQYGVLTPEYVWHLLQNSCRLV